MVLVEGEVVMIWILAAAASEMEVVAERSVEEREVGRGEEEGRNMKGADRRRNMAGMGVLATTGRAREREEWRGAKAFIQDVES